MAQELRYLKTGSRYEIRIMRSGDMIFIAVELDDAIDRVGKAERKQRRQRIVWASGLIALASIALAVTFCMSGRLF